MVQHRNIEEHGFPQELHGKADALFLDLPGPWKVRVPAHILQLLPALWVLGTASCWLLARNFISARRLPPSLLQWHAIQAWQ